MACGGCGKNTKIINTTAASTSTVTSSIPEGDRVKVKYLGGNYRHKILSPNGAIFPYGIYNYGYGQYGIELIIHKGDLVPEDGSPSKFEKLAVEEPEVEAQTVSSETEDEPETVKETETAFKKLKGK